MTYITVVSLFMSQFRFGKAVVKQRERENHSVAIKSKRERNADEEKAPKFSGIKDQ